LAQKYLTWCAFRWCKTTSLHSSKFLHQKWSNSTVLVLSATREKNFSFHFKHYNLTIYVVNFCKTFCTCSPSSLGQDPTVESAKKLKKLICASWARNGSSGVFFEKKGHGPLGVKETLLPRLCKLKMSNMFNVNKFYSLLCYFGTYKC
jgi:hypothetical protein